MKHDIGIDIRMINHTGIGTYLRGFLTGIKDCEDASCCYAPVLLGDKQLKDLPERFCVKSFDAPIYSLQEQIAYPFILPKYKLWHAPHYNVPVLKGNAKLVVTIHDLIHWIFRDRYSKAKQFYAKFMLKKAINSSDHIIAVSNHTKNDIMKYFDAPEEKISVIYESVGNSFIELAPDLLETKFKKIQQKYSLPPAFFLYVGLIKPHKNVMWLLRIFDELKKNKRLDASLVIVGKDPEGKLNNSPYKKNFVFLNNIEKDEIVTLYNYAIALIHPSLYEGFGLTLLESMACGTPVIATKSASIPEVVGDAAMLVDSSSDSDMMNAIAMLEKNAKMRFDLTEKGLKRIKYFSWKKTAQKTIEVYKKVLSAK